MDNVQMSKIKSKFVNTRRHRKMRTTDQDQRPSRGNKPIYD